MLRQSKNAVRIEGILSEINLKEGSFTKNGQPMDDINGTITIKTQQKTKTGVVDVEIPVHMFAAKITNKGTPNPAYLNLEKIMNDFTSIAAAGNEEEADKVRISNGNITMNEYYGQNGNLISFPRIRANFVTKVSEKDYNPQATFETEIYVINLGPETDKDDIETGRVKVTGGIAQYGGNIDVVNFYASNPNVISAINENWAVGDTAKVQGYLNFTHSTETVESQVDFGEPILETRTITVSELMITGGGQPMDGDFAFTEEDVRQALVERKERLEAQKERSNKKATSAKPAAGLSDLGF